MPTIHRKVSTVQRLTIRAAEFILRQSGRISQATLIVKMAIIRGNGSCRARDMVAVKTLATDNATTGAVAEIVTGEIGTSIAARNPHTNTTNREQF